MSTSSSILRYIEYVLPSLIWLYMVFLGKMNSGFLLFLQAQNLATTTISQRSRLLSIILQNCQPFTLKTFQEFMVDLLKTRKASAVNKYVQTAKSYGEYLKIDWTANLRQLKEQASPRVLLSDSEIESLIHLEPIPHRLSVFWACVAFTRARPSEITGLTRDDIDLGTRSIYITAKKTKTTRTIPISDVLYPILKSYMATSSTNLLFHVKYKPQKQMYSCQIRADFIKRLKRLNINKNVCPYSLRHSYITRILDNEANLFAVQGIVGHKKADTTQQYYRGSMKAMRKASRRDPMNSLSISRRDRLKQVFEEIKGSGMLDIEGVSYSISSTKITIEIEPEEAHTDANAPSFSTPRLALD